MVSTVVLSGTGSEVPGAMARLVAAVGEAGAGIVSQNTVRLEGKLAIMMKLEMAADAGEQLAAGLSQRFPGWVFRCAASATTRVATGAGRIIELEVKWRQSQDPAGALRSALGGLDCQVERLESQRLPVIGLGETVFTAKCAVRVPVGIDAQSLAEEVELVLDGARVRAA